MTAGTAGRVFALTNEPGSLGLSCSSKGVVLAGIPLLNRNDNRLVPRPLAEIHRLVSSAYKADINVTSVVEGLGVVSRAINSGDMTRAMIAAVQLRLPELDWEGAARIAAADDALTKYNPLEPRDWHGRWTTDGDVDPVSTMPVVFHPFAGTVPTPSASPQIIPAAASDPESSQDARGSSASVEGSPAQNDDPFPLPAGWLHLPPGDRIDELGALVEWIANATHEDEQAIRAEIKRLFYDAGDIMGGNTLNRAVSDVVDEPPGSEFRADILGELDRYTHTDPAEMGAIRQFLTGLALLRPGLRSLPPPIAEIPEEAPSPLWQLGWAARGKAIEQEMGHNLPVNFPIVDKWEAGIATSIKTIDLSEKMYQNAGLLSKQINGYVGMVANFNGARFAGAAIEPELIQGRALNLVVPRGSITPLQQAVIAAAKARAASLGVNLIITPF